MEDCNDDSERHARYTPKPPILWQNSDKTVALFDIPHSISAAQEHTSPLQLLSSSPLQAPFPSNEPKSVSAKAKLGRNTVDAELHAEYERLLVTAIREVRRSCEGQWCLLRPFCEDGPRVARKRKLEQSEEDVVESPLPLIKKPISSVTPAFIQHTASFYTNDTDSTVHLQRPTLTSITAFATFYIPPRASFYLGDCADSQAFHTALRAQYRRNDNRTDFDFILLDPPWPNRSVKRTHQTSGSTYSTSSSLLDLRELILDMRLDSIMVESCLVGVWITNKPAVRELVLGEDGLFAHWGVEIMEEWIWLKTTIYGEPVTPLDALWRKPYEVLLLGRKRRKVTAEGTDPVPGFGKEGARLKRRVIIAVPDLHSRKPCLKVLIEPLMPDPSNCRVLEVFARHLVAGWWSWGDECIKFNWEACWREEGRESG